MENIHTTLNTTQHNTIQHNTTQHNTTQHNTTDEEIYKLITTISKVQKENSYMTEIWTKLKQTADLLTQHNTTLNPTTLNSIDSGKSKITNI